MRPINRGVSPGTFLDYQNARGPLIRLLGQYCSYCEMHVGVGLAVEHMQPKSLNPSLELVWDNFLLACTNCNSNKFHQPISLRNYFWPDSDNTARAFVYSVGGVIEVNVGLNASEQAIAVSTIGLTGLNKRPAVTTTASDRRWLNRQVAWEVAEEALQDLQVNDTVQLRNQVVRNAQGRGFFSVWMTVFQSDADMLNRFIAAFPGTANTCFDPTTGQCLTVTRGQI